MKSLYTTRAAARRMAIVFVCAFQLATSLSALDYYWVNGSGLWSDHNSHWATTSGGNVFHDQVPTSMDNVYFDANSFPAGGTVTIDQTIIYCMDMDWTGVLNNPIFTGPADKTMYVYGSMSFATDMHLNFLGTVQFLSLQVGQTIRSGGQIFQGQVFFQGVSGEWSLMDDFRTNQDFMFLEGTFHSNDHDMWIGRIFRVSDTIYLGTSVVSIQKSSETPIINCPAVNFHADAAHFKLLGGGYLGSANETLTFYKVTFTGPGGGNFYKANVTDKLLFEGEATIALGNGHVHEAELQKTGYFYGDGSYDFLKLSAGQTYFFETGKTQTISAAGALDASGSGCGNFITLTTFSGPATISKSGDAVALNDVVLMNIAATGGAAFSAINCIDLGNNSGWSITPAASRNLYWVGGGGDWGDAAHWSLNSGGAGGECLPTAYDNVLFDAGSGFAPAQSVLVSQSEIYCKNMDWDGVLNNPVFQSTSNHNKLFHYGSLRFSSGMQNNFTGQWTFRASTSGNTITSAGKALVSQGIIFEGTGEWSLQDDFTALSLYFTNAYGTLRTNNHTMRVGGNIWAAYADARLVLGSSDIFILGNTEVGFSTNPGNLDAGTAHFQFLQEGSIRGVLGNGTTVYKVSFQNPATYGRASFFDHQ